MEFTRDGSLTDDMVYADWLEDHGRAAEAEGLREEQNDACDWMLELQWGMFINISRGVGSGSMHTSSVVTIACDVGGLMGVAVPVYACGSGVAPDVEPYQHGYPESAIGVGGCEDPRR